MESNCHIAFILPPSSIAAPVIRSRNFFYDNPSGIPIKRSRRVMGCNAPVCGAHSNTSSQGVVSPCNLRSILKRGPFEISATSASHQTLIELTLHGSASLMELE